jgi:DNA polymerase-3 subunit delta
MVIFIFGDDIYQSEQRLLELKEKFKEKYGDINISIFNIDKKEKITPRIINEMESVPFLGNKRLIIIKNYIQNSDSESKEKIIKKLEHISESSVVIFYEKGTPKKNDKLFKQLLKVSKSEELPRLSGLALNNWIRKEVDKRGGKIDSIAAERLAYKVQNDSLRISSEIDKLINYVYPKTITIEDVESLVAETYSVKVFDLVDSLARRDGHSSLVSLHRLLALGEKEEYLHAMIVYGFRNLILVKYLSENSGLKESEMAKKLALHPFVLKKALASSKFFSFLELKKIYQLLLRANLEMRKSNKEPILVLDLILAEICVR